MNGFHFNGWPLLPWQLQGKLRHVLLSFWGAHHGFGCPFECHKTSERSWEGDQQQTLGRGEIPNLGKSHLSGFLFVSFSEGSSIYYSFPKLVNGIFFCFFVKMWIWREILKSSQFQVVLSKTDRLTDWNRIVWCVWQPRWCCEHRHMGCIQEKFELRGAVAHGRGAKRSNMWSKLMKTPWDICWEALSFDLKQLLGILLADFYFCVNFDLKIV